MSLAQILQEQTEKIQASFKAQTGASAELVQAVLIPVNIPQEGGNLRVYLQVSGEAVENEQTFKAVLDVLGRKFELAVYSSNSGGGTFKRRTYGGYRNA